MTAAFSVAHCYTSPLNSSSPHRACKTDGVKRCSAAAAPSAWSNGYTLLVVVVTARYTVDDQHDHVEC